MNATESKGLKRGSRVYPLDPRLRAAGPVR
jgi:hypothetical protein